jgi:hypothetical protein
MNHLRRLPRPARQRVPEELAFHHVRDALDYGRMLVSEDVRTPASLEEWVRHRHEYDACLGETMLLARLDYSDQVADTSRRDWLDGLHQDLGATRLELDHRLDAHYLSSPARSSLPNELQAAVEVPLLVRQRTWMETNLALLERIQELELEYIQVMGNLSVPWVGRPASLPELRHQLKSCDPLARRRAWEARGAALSKVRPELEDLLDEMLALREQVARNANCQDWNGYLALLGREPWPGEDVQALASTEAPWDLLAPCALVDVQESEDPEQILADLQEWLKEADSDVDDTLTRLRTSRLLDLVDRPGKFELDCCGWLAERRLPVLRLSAYQLSDDLCRFLRLLHAAHRALSERGLGLSRLEPVVELEPVDLQWAVKVAEQLLQERGLDSGRAQRSRQRLQHARRLELDAARRQERWAWWVHENPGAPRELRRLQWVHQLVDTPALDVSPAEVADTLFLETAFFLPEWGPPSLALVLEEGWRGVL